MHRAGSGLKVRSNTHFNAYLRQFGKLLWEGFLELEPDLVMTVRQERVAFSTSHFEDCFQTPGARSHIYSHMAGTGLKSLVSGKMQRVFLLHEHLNGKPICQAD